MMIRTRRLAAKTCMCCPPRRTRSLRSPTRPASNALGAPIRVTFGELVEVVESVTANLAEQVAVLDYVLGGSREGRSA